MTEAEWLACAHPYEMIIDKHCRNDRKRRLLACACARRLLSWVPDGRFAAAVDLSERYADGQATAADLSAGRKAIKVAVCDLRRQSQPDWIVAAAYCAQYTLEKSFSAYRYAIDAAQTAQGTRVKPDWDAAYKKESARQCALVRDIFSNTFRNTTIDRACLAPTVQHLAVAIYDTSAFDRLPILADALEDASCTDADVLEHCREAGPHARGCWVVDLLTGRQ